MSTERGRHRYWAIATVVLLCCIVIVVILLNVIDKPLQRLREKEPENINDFLDELLAQIPPQQDALRLTLRPEAQRGFNAGLISRDDDPLRVRLSKPEGVSFPTVIIVHDAPSSEPQTDVVDVELGQPLVDVASVVTLTVDWRSHDGDVDGQVRDVLSVLDWEEKLNEKKAVPVTIIGVGSGAVLALRAAQQHTAVDGLLLVDVPESADRTALTAVSAAIPVLEWNTASDGAFTAVSDSGLMHVADRAVLWLNSVTAL